MLLAVDIGNTNVVAGVFDGETLVTNWRIATERNRTADEYGVMLASLFSGAHLDLTTIDGVILASVVPVVQTALREASRKYLGHDPLLVSTSLELGVEVRYNPPTGVGADRIANAVAAIALYRTPAVVVDFGTGTNFDVIAGDGAYLGGAIAPGIEISMEALFSRTSRLPQIPLDPPVAAIGTSTVGSLQSGILFGYAGLVDGLVTRIASELQGAPEVIATGGLAEVVAPYTRTVGHINPDLTLIGLRMIYQRNAPHAERERVRQD